MNPDQWKEIERIFQAALEIVPENRADFLDRSCGTDRHIRQEVESLLQFHHPANPFMEEAAIEIAAEILADAENRRIEMQRGSMAGRKFGPYVILKWIGGGGMGDVYLAQDTMQARLVALKTMLPEVLQNEDCVRRFQREARAAFSLEHTNTVTIYDVGASDGVHYIATEFVQGQTLRQRMNAGRIPLRQAVDISIQVAKALVAAHTAGIIHRDIKPENAIIRDDAIVKVLDFGLAKLIEAPTAKLYDPNFGDESSTDTGVILGTIRYMSPEQARGKKIDPRTDLFSLGVVMYEMIASRPPFFGTSMIDTFVALISDEPEPLSKFIPQTPQQLEVIVTKCLQKNPKERYQSAEELLRALEKVKNMMNVDTVE